MTIITIDYNNDEITVSDEAQTLRHGVNPTVIAKGAWCVEKKQTDLIYEVINAVFKSGNVRLDEISEDVRFTREEW